MKRIVRRTLLFPLRPFLLKPVLELLRRIRVLPVSNKNPEDPPKRVLVVNITDFLGDTVMMMPLLDRLHAAVPDAQVDIVTSVAMGSFVSQIPYLGEIHTIDTRRTRLPVWNVYRKLAHMVRFVQTKLHHQQYDLCLLPRWGADASMSIFLASMTGAAKLVGHDPEDDVATEPPFPHVQDLLDCVSHGGVGLPEAIRELRLLEACGLVGRLDVAAEEKKGIEALRQIAARFTLSSLRQKFSLEDGSYLILAPGASHPARRWPPERFATTARSLHKQFGFTTVVIGGPGDVAIGQSIEQHAGIAVRNLVGLTSLSETVAMVGGAALLLTNDSGPAHVGAGLGVPTIVLSACPLTSVRENANSPLRVRPIGPAVRVLQPPGSAGTCDERCLSTTAHCILGLEVEFVTSQADQLLSEANGSRAVFESNV